MHKPRVIIMRHSERLDTVLGGNQWPHEAFVNGFYMPHTTQMPTMLPFRDDPLEYCFDTPLSRYGKSHAFHTGEFFRSVRFIPHRVYSSPAMRCVQTADAVLDGLGQREKAPLRLDLALHEPTKVKLPIQSAEFYSSAGFHVDLNYRPSLAPENNRVIVNEHPVVYYRRMYRVLKRITTKLIRQNMPISSPSNPPTILIVTHRDCVPLLGAFLNIDHVENKSEYLRSILNNREKVRFLSMVVAEYDKSLDSWIFLPELPAMPMSMTEYYFSQSDYSSSTVAKKKRRKKFF